MAGEAEYLEMRIGPELVEERSFADGRERAVVAINGNPDHAQGCRGLPQAQRVRLGSAAIQHIHLTVSATIVVLTSVPLVAVTMIV